MLKNRCLSCFIALTFIGMLSGCAAPVRSSHLSPKTETYDKLDYNPSLEHRIVLGDVTLGEEAKASPIPLASVDMQAALRSALLTSGYGVRGDQEGDLVLEASLTKLDTPLIGLSLTTTSTIYYSITQQQTGEMIWEVSVMMPSMAEFSESFDAQERLRLSIEKSIQENITHMLVALGDAAIPPASSVPVAKVKNHKGKKS